MEGQARLTMARRARNGLSTQEAAILAYLSLHGPAGAPELARHLGISPSAVRVIVMEMRHRLESVNIVSRKRVVYQLENVHEKVCYRRRAA